MSNFKAVKATAVIALMCAAMVSATPVAADSTRTTVAGEGSARFDWMANKKVVVASAPAALTQAPRGSGSWICSPAGFGRKSSCYAR